MYPLEDQFDIIIKKLRDTILSKNDNLSWRVRRYNYEEGCLIEIFLRHPESNPGEYQRYLQEEYEINMPYDNIVQFLRYNSLNIPESRLEFIEFVQSMVHHSISFMKKESQNRESMESSARELYSFVSKPNWVENRIIRSSKKIFLLMFCSSLFANIGASQKFSRSVQELQESIKEAKISHCIEIVYRLYCVLCDLQKIEHQKLDSSLILKPVQTFLSQKISQSHADITEKILEEGISQRDELENCFTGLELVLKDRLSEEIQIEWDRIFDALTQLLPVQTNKIESPLRLRRLLDVCLFYHQEARVQRLISDGKNLALALQNISLFLQYVDCFPLTDWRIFDTLTERPPDENYPSKILYEDRQGNPVEDEILSLYKGSFLVLSPGWLFQKKKFSPPILCCHNFSVKE